MHRQTPRALFSPASLFIPNLVLFLIAALLVASLAESALSAGLPVPTICQNDVQGANDLPGQRDLTRYCIDRGDGAPYEYYTLINADEVAISGNNTLDLCFLFDTDGDAYANNATCVTLESSGAAGGNKTQLKAVRQFSCSDGRADRCTSPAVLAGPQTTTCQVSHPDTDPFSPAVVNGPGGAYPYDSEVLCAIDVHDFGADTAKLLNVGSLPSQNPNSAFDDYILPTGGPAADCNDNNPCTADSVDSTGACVFTPLTGAACSDGLFCTGDEICNDLGFCGAGTPRSCDDGVACTIDACDEYTDTCVHDPRASLCDDARFCDGVETCDPAVGCVAGTPADCTDDVACTADRCDAATDACVHDPVSASCNDGNVCNGVETCDAVQGCVAGPAPKCDDGIACTVDTCDESAGGCVHTPNDAACSDDRFCNGTFDRCDETADLCTHPSCRCSSRRSCRRRCRRRSPKRDRSW